MNLKRLQYFVSFAARPPGKGQRDDWEFVKTHITALEKELGVELVSRKSAQLGALTPAGRYFFKEATRLLAAHELALAQAMDHNEGVAGGVRVGLCEEAATTRFAGTLRRYAMTCPGVTVDVVEGHSIDLIRSVKRREVDIALTLPEVDDGSLAVHDLWRDDWAVALQQQHALARRASLSCADLANEPLVLADPLLPRHGHEYIRAAFSAAGVEPVIGALAVNRSTMLMLATIGVGATFVPQAMLRASTRRQHEAALKFMPFAVPALQICAILVANDPPRAAVQFLHAAQAIAAAGA